MEMAELDPKNTNSAVNGDNVAKGPVNDQENNSEADVLLKVKNTNVSDGAEGKLCTNRGELPTSSNSSSEQTPMAEHCNQSNNASGNINPAEVAVESCLVSASSNGIAEKSVTNTYFVSTDSDDDRNAQRIPMYRSEVIDVSDNSDSSDSETSSTVSDDNDDSDNVSVRSSSDKSDVETKKTSGGPRTRGELTLQDLPPIEDLKISVDENKCKPVGSVLNIVDEMVVIQSFPNTPPLDIDTVLFLDRGQRALGKIFDVFGPVHEPFYSIRFNSRTHIQEKDVRREQVVYCAPQTEYTSYIPVSQLLKEKGSDASWLHNNEPPVMCLDFSDDEEEAQHKRPKVSTGSKRDAPSDNDLFVKRMNQKNLELTAKRRKEDEAKQKRGSVLRKVMSGPASQPGESLMNAAAHPFTPFTRSRTFTNSSSNSGSIAIGNLDVPNSTSFFHHPVTASGAAAAVVVNSHSSPSPPSSKFDSSVGPVSAAPRAINYLRNAAAAAAAAASYTPPPPPLNYAFPAAAAAPHFMCSSPHQQLPNQPQPPSPASAVAAAAAAAAAATQNYLAMYHAHAQQHHHQHHHPARSVTGPPQAASAPSSVQPTLVATPYVSFTAASIPPMPTFVTQPQAPHHQHAHPHPHAHTHHHHHQPQKQSQQQQHPVTVAAPLPPPSSVHPGLPPSFNAAVPPPFAAATFSALPTPPLPSSLPQPTFATTGGAPTTFIPLNVRGGGVPAAFHPQFVLPPPPPPPPPGALPHLASQSQHQHQRDVSMGSRVTPDRRTQQQQQQSPHQLTNTYYSSSPSNS